MDIQTLPFHNRFGNHDLALAVETYEDNGRLAVDLLCLEDGDLMPYAMLTVNLPREAVKPNEAFIKDFDENQGLLQFVLDNHLGTLCPERGFSGFCSYPKIAFDMERLKDLDREGTEVYLHSLEKQQTRTKTKPKRKER